MKVIKFRGVHDISNDLGVDVQTVRRWIHSGKLRAFKPGKEYRIQEADLEAFLRAREVRPKALSRSPSEPSLFNGPEDERHAVAGLGHPRPSARAEGHLTYYGALADLSEEQVVEILEGVRDGKVTVKEAARLLAARR